METDRQIQFFAQCQQHSTLSGAVQFGDYQSADGDGFSKNPGLLQGILSGGGIQYEQHLMRCTRQ